MSIRSLARAMTALTVVFGAGLALTAPVSGSATVPRKVLLPGPAVHPGLWPNAKSPIGLDPMMEARIDKIIAGMTVEEKVGQVIQPEWKSITPEEVAQYHIGSIENGGGSVPAGNKHATVKDWVDLIEPYYQASVRQPSAKAGQKTTIPLIWASDAVHGHNNVYGATLFPHNIGLGAAHDPALIERIGHATAEEVRSTG